MTKDFPQQMDGWDIFRENAMQFIMYIVGAVLVGWVWWPLSLVYLAYCILSNVLYMAWVCPYCAHYSLGTCKAGFHILSAGRFKAKEGMTFAKAFKNNIYMMFPGWFLPPIAAIYLLMTSFSWAVLTLLIVFCVVAFWLLPMLARSHCEDCETLDCPRRPKSAAAKDSS
jgi:hypothetical protein